MICPRCSVGEISEATQECLVCGFSRTGGVMVEASDWTQTDDPVLPALERQFQVEGVLRRGAASRFYLARDQVSGRLCSLKVLPLGEEVPGLIERFREDAQRAAKLDHPHIVSLLSFGATDEAVWFAMEYVQGRSLGDLLRTADRMDLKTCLRLVEQIASALEYGHRRGITHGNVKPANVLVDPEGWARLADFGVNAAFGPLPRRQPELSAEENYGHVAPECFGPDGQAGPAADQYALAVLAFGCLARRPPFVGETLEEISRHHLEGPVPVLAETRPDLPAAVSAALARAMSRREADRFPGILDFVTALAGVAPPEPAVAPAAVVLDEAELPATTDESAPAMPAPEPESKAEEIPTAESKAEEKPAQAAAPAVPEPEIEEEEEEPEEAPSEPAEPRDPVTAEAEAKPEPETEAKVEPEREPEPKAEPAREKEPTRPPLLFVERGLRPRRLRDDDRDDEDEDEEADLAAAHAKPAPADDDDEPRDDPREPVLLWPGARDRAAATATESAARTAPGLEDERPPLLLMEEARARKSSGAEQIGQRIWWLSDRWRALSRPVRYGSGAGAAVLLMALVWWRVASGKQDTIHAPRVVGAPPVSAVESTPAQHPAPAHPRTAQPRPTPTQTPTTGNPVATNPTGTPRPPRDTAAAPQPASTTEPAHLFINSTPWGVLSVDDKVIGNVPQADVKVPPGTHTIRITRDGYLPYETIIAIEAGEKLYLTDIVLQEKTQ
jgi:serine/threonine protein kinase